MAKEMKRFNCIGYTMKRYSRPLAIRETTIEYDYTSIVDTTNKNKKF
jgi:hypothetical protein